MANISISQLETAAQQSISDLFEVAIPDDNSNTGYASCKASMAQIADFMSNDVQYIGLETEAKSLVGAINEAAQSGGDGTEVEANPTGEATDTLKKIGIDGTVFSIEGGGGEDIKVIEGETVPLTLSNSKVGGFNLTEVGGAMKQDTTTGKNKLKMTVASIKAANTSGTWSGNVYTYQSCTFEILTDDNVIVKGIKVNGTTTENVWFNVMSAEYSLAAGSYNLNGIPGNAPSSIVLRLLDSSGVIARAYRTDDTSFSSGETILITRLDIQIPANTNFTNIIVFPMIRLSTETDDTFEPYTGGIPAPNPDFPQPIKKVTVSGIKVTGKNLCEINDIEVSYQYLTQPIYVKGSTDIFVSLKAERISRATISNYQIYGFTILEYDTNGDYIKVSRSGTKELTGNNIVDFSLNITTESNCSYIVINLGNNNGDNNVNARKFDIQLEKSNIQTAYEPYHSKTIQLSTPIDLYGTDDVKNVLYRDADGLVKRDVKYAVVDLGSLTWIYNSEYQRFITRSLVNYIRKDGGYNSGLICDALIASGDPVTIPTTGQNYTIGKYTDGNIYVIYRDYTDATAFKTAMSGVMLVYELAEPTTETLPAADQIALNSIPTYDTVTYLELLETEIEPEVSGEYGVSKVGGDTLLALLTAWTNERRQTNGGHIYSTEEQVVGTWTDGKPVYERIIEFSQALVLSGSTWAATEMSNSNIKGIVNIIGYAIIPDTEELLCFNYIAANVRQSNQDYISIMSTRSGTTNITSIKIQYTKTTD